MKNVLCGVLLSLLLFSCNEAKNNSEELSENSKTEIENMLDKWHEAAAKADFETYFSLMAENSVFIGTDPSENWDLEEFKNFSKPYFKNGKAWDFTSLERNIYFSETSQTAWFDELLKTQMGLCRGSGVLVRKNGSWKIAHYVLSMTVPNHATKEVAHLKENFDQSYIEKLISRKNN